MSAVARQTERYFLYDPWNRADSDEIEKDFYDSIHRSDQFISRYVAFEEAIVGIRYAMYDFEKFVLTISLDYEENRGSDHSYFQDMRVRANGKVVSVLNAITSFRDQFPKFKETVKQIEGRVAFLENWKLHKEVDVHFDFCEVLRNYSQHHTQPVSRVTVGGSWDKDHTWRESHSSIFVSVSAVAADRALQPSQRERFLSQIGEMADVSLVLRKSMDCIGDISREMRSWLTPDFEQSCATYATALGTAKRERFPYLLLTRESDGGEGRQIFPDFLNYAKKLRTGQLPSHTANGYVSNKARGHSEKS